MQDHHGQSRKYQDPDHDPWQRNRLDHRVHHLAHAHESPGPPDHLDVFNGAFDDVVDCKRNDGQIVAPGFKTQTSTQPTLIDYAEDLLEKVLGEAHFADLKETPEYREALNKITEKLKQWIVQSSPGFFKHIPLIILFLFKGISDFLISILFSFIIVLQLPSLKTGFSRLENSRLSRFYEEIVPDIIGFGRSIGRAFQAQAFIAICNTLLTFLGLVFFNVPSPIFLSLIVFICSFIPILGIFLSSLPICMLGLQTGGFALVLKLALFIIGIHLMEAYVLNPKIMGAVMHIHFLAVLIILLVAGNLFGFWGLLLGIPTFQYIFNQIIMNPNKASNRMGQA